MDAQSASDFNTVMSVDKKSAAWSGCKLKTKLGYVARPASKKKRIVNIAIPEITKWL